MRRGLVFPGQVFPAGGERGANECVFYDSYRALYDAIGQYIPSIGSDWTVQVSWFANPVQTGIAAD